MTHFVVWYIENCSCCAELVGLCRMNNNQHTMENVSLQIPSVYIYSVKIEYKTFMESSKSNENNLFKQYL